MDSTMLIVLLIVIVAAPVLGAVLKKMRAGSEKYQQIMEDFKQAVEAMLDENEQVEAICGYKPCAAVTTKRLLVSTRQGIDVIRFSEIKKLNGLNASGNKTRNPSSMLVFEIKADKKYVLGNHSEGFDEVVQQLYKYTGH